MKNKFHENVIFFIVVSVFFSIFVFANSVSNNKNPCLHNPQAQWATVNKSAWFSMTPTDGDWTTNKTDKWFYELRGSQKVIVLSKQTNYYMTCYYYGKNNDPIMGWVYKDMLILESR